MILRRQDSTWEVRAPAKINLCLDVLGRRDDGYHELETLMVPLSLHDSVAVTSLPARNGRVGEIDLQVLSPSADFQVLPSVGGGSVPRGRNNLVYRAVESLRRAAGVPSGARIRLIKRIPMDAGLGGGSSDAAATLVAANAAWNLKWDRTRLGRVAAAIGSDVPFFLDGGAAICRGRGEQVAPVPHATPIHVVIVMPPAGLSTADVFRSLDTSSHPPFEPSWRIAEAVAALVAGRLADLGRLIFNQLEHAARRLSEWIDRLAHAFDKHVDVAGHMMTGSGTAYFGLCRNAVHARRAAGTLRGLRVGWICSTQAVTG